MKLNEMNYLGLLELIEINHYGVVDNDCEVVKSQYAPSGNDGINILSHGIFHISPSYRALEPRICPRLHIVPPYGRADIWSLGQIRGSRARYEG